MQTLLLISADIARSNAIIHALKLEHDIWHVARQRDGMTWLKNHRPETIILDLDLLEQDADTILQAIETTAAGNNPHIIGFSKRPEQLPHPC